jgi:ubiquinone/menaquinone biosynthesis C-methylase UbiE
MCIKIPESRIIFLPEPEDAHEYTNRLDQAYSKYAKAYDIAVKLFPVWKTWLKRVLPHIEGKRVLEASFGTGYLLLQYASQHESYGIDYNARMVEIAENNLSKIDMHADLQKGNVEELPFPDEYFDCIVNTMAFSGYPNGEKALKEFHRTLRPGGKLILLDFNYPSNRNLFGYLLVKLMERGGDILKDISKLLDQLDFKFIDNEIGGWGSVHLYIAKKELRG